MWNCGVVENEKSKKDKSQKDIDGNVGKQNERMSIL